MFDKRKPNKTPFNPFKKITNAALDVKNNNEEPVKNFFAMIKEFSSFDFKKVPLKWYLSFLGLVIFSIAVVILFAKYF